jgi:hypothetical protein
VAGKHRAIQKATDRRSEQGDDLSVAEFKVGEYQLDGGMVKATAAVRAKIRACDRRPLMRRTSLSQHTLEKIERGERVRTRTLPAVLKAIGMTTTGGASP